MAELLLPWHRAARCAPPTAVAARVPPHVAERQRELAVESSCLPEPSVLQTRGRSRTNFFDEPLRISRCFDVEERVRHRRVGAGGDDAASVEALVIMNWDPELCVVLNSTLHERVVLVQVFQLVDLRLDLALLLPDGA